MLFSRFRKRLRNIFVTGLLVTVPVVFTFFILNFLFKTLDNSLSPVFTKLLIFMGVSLKEGFRVPGIGLSMTVLIILVVGLLTTNIFGKKLVAVGEAIVEKIPFVRSVYNGTKQVVSSVAQADTRAFSKCVLVEFPRQGVYAMGFVTGVAKGEVQVKTAEKVLNIFIPTTPNPTSGFLVFVPEKETIELTMTIEDGIKLIISGGIVTPDYHGAAIKELEGVQGVTELKDMKV